MATVLPSMKTLFTLLKEINLEHIRQGSNEPFEIVLTGNKANLVTEMLQSNRVRLGTDTQHSGLKISVFVPNHKKPLFKKKLSWFLLWVKLHFCQPLLITLFLLTGHKKVSKTNSCPYL